VAVSALARLIIQDVVNMTRNLTKDPEGLQEEMADVENAVDAIIRDCMSKRTENFSGMKISVSGSARSGDAWSKGEVARLYYEGRAAWMTGDLETVADMFGVLA
jgi:hypothetical protein